MKAVVLNKTCKASELKVSEIPKPSIKDGWVLIKVLGFGINHSEIVLRESEANEDYINLPIVPGIECYGIVVDNSNTRFKNDDHVVALMGGMGRNFNGSYEEYALIPESNVFKISDKIIKKYRKEEISAIPETFFTAYSSLFDSLKLNDDDIILIRGASSTVGIAAIQLASKTKAKIIATTRNPVKLESLKKYGATDTLIDDENLIDNIISLYPGGVTKILELIGPKTLNNSFKVLKAGGILCITGILGGEELLNKYDPIKQIPNNRYLTSFFSNYPTQQKIDKIFTYIYQNDIKPIIAATYTLDEISKAHMKTEKNKKLGKIVILN